MNAPTPKLLSIMIPSRSRFEKLASCIARILAQLGEEGRKEVEFIVKLDCDDKSSLDQLQRLPFDKVDLQVVVASKLGGYRDLYKFYNQCARLSRGTFLLMWNDDANFQTNNWYSLFKQRVTTTQSAYSYWFAGTATRVQAPGQESRIEDWPCFIAHHRLLYEIIGFYGHQGGVDSFLYYVLGPLGLLNKIQEISVEHTAWFDIPNEKRDQTSNANAQDGTMLPTDFRVVQLCQEKIKEFVTRTQSTQRRTPQMNSNLPPA